METRSDRNALEGFGGLEFLGDLFDHGHILPRPLDFLLAVSGKFQIRNIMGNGFRHKNPFLIGQIVQLYTLLAHSSSPTTVRFAARKPSKRVFSGKISSMNHAA